MLVDKDAPLGWLISDRISVQEGFPATKTANESPSDPTPWFNDKIAAWWEGPSSGFFGEAVEVWQRARPEGSVG